MSAPRVLGVDPSLKATGVCLPDGWTFTIKTGEAIVGDRRLHILRTALRTYVRRALPLDLGAIEVPTQFRSGDAAIAAGMAQGICREVLIEYGVPYGLVHPTSVKMFGTGRGDADKALMIATADRHRKHRAYLGEVTEAVGDDNQADAWWIYQMCRRYFGVDDLDPDLDEWLNPHLIREAKTKPGKITGAKWPGGREGAAIRARRANR